jgi:hypothetical protein
MTGDRRMDAKKSVPSVSFALSQSDRILILFCMILFIVVTGCTSVPEKPQLSKDQIIIAAGGETEIQNLIGNHTFRIADAKTGASLADSTSGKKPAREVWLVPLSVCHDDFEYIYMIEMTRDGNLYAVSDRPAHVAYPPRDMRANSTDPCLSG